MSSRSLRRRAPSGLAALALSLGLAVSGGTATPAVQKATGAAVPRATHCVTPAPTTTVTSRPSPTITDSPTASPCPTTASPRATRTGRPATPTPAPTRTRAPGQTTPPPAIAPGPSSTDGAQNFHVTEQITPVGGSTFRSGAFGRSGTATAARLHEIHIEHIEDREQRYVRVAWHFRDALPGSHVEYVDQITGPDGQPVPTHGDTHLNVRFHPATGRIDPSSAPTDSPPVLQFLQQYEEANNFVGFALGVQADVNGGPRPLRVGDFEQPNSQFGTMFVSFIDIVA